MENIANIFFMPKNILAVKLLYALVLPYALWPMRGVFWIGTHYVYTKNTRMLECFKYRVYNIHISNLAPKEIQR